MKIATYNVNGIGARLPVLLRWLAETQPDVVCLQELKAPQENFPLSAINEAGYQAIWQGQKSWNGVAILSKGFSITERKRGLDGEPEDEQSRYIEALVNDTIIGCLYLPNGNPLPGEKFDYKLRWMKRFHAHASALLAEKKPIVLTGDYNAIPTTLDAYKAERWVEDALFRLETREAFKNLLDLGYTDALRKLFPEKIIYTYWDYFRNAFARDAGIRIDHFLLNDLATAKLMDGGVDKATRGWEKSSDHGPVWITLE